MPPPYPPASPQFAQDPPSKRPRLSNGDKPPSEAEQTARNQAQKLVDELAMEEQNEATRHYEECERWRAMAMRHDEDIQRMQDYEHWLVKQQTENAELQQTLEHKKAALLRVQEALRSRHAPPVVALQHRVEELRKRRDAARDLLNEITECVQGTLAEIDGNTAALGFPGNARLLGAPKVEHTQNGNGARAPSPRHDGGGLPPPGAGGVPPHFYPPAPTR